MIKIDEEQALSVLDKYQINIELETNLNTGFLLKALL